MPHEGNRRARGSAPPILAAPALQVLQLQLLDFEDFLFFGPGGLVDFVHVGVGQLLDLVVGPLVLVFGDLLVLEERLDGLVAIATDVAHRYAMVLGDAVPSLAGFRPRSETRMAFSIGPICEASQGVMVMRLGSGTCRVATWLRGEGVP